MCFSKPGSPQPVKDVSSAPKFVPVSAVPFPQPFLAPAAASSSRFSSDTVSLSDDGSYAASRFVPFDGLLVSSDLLHRDSMPFSNEAVPIWAVFEDLPDFFANCPDWTVRVIVELVTDSRLEKFFDSLSLLDSAKSLANKCLWKGSRDVSEIVPLGYHFMVENDALLVFHLVAASPGSSWVPHQMWPNNASVSSMEFVTLVNRMQRLGSMRFSSFDGSCAHLFLHDAFDVLDASRSSSMLNIWCPTADVVFASKVLDRNKFAARDLASAFQVASNDLSVEQNNARLVCSQLVANVDALKLVAAVNTVLGTF